jgi:hypothetical protein
MWNRAEHSRENGVLDFDELLYVGEAIYKTYVAGIVAAVDDEPNRHRYRLTHKIVRANSLGDWDDVLAELSTGTPVQHLRPAAVDVQQELTARFGPGSWMHEAVRCLDSCIRAFIPDAEPLPVKFDGRKWFSQLVFLRNRTRGHGAPTAQQKATAALDLEKSLRLVGDNGRIFRQEWAYLKRNLSGRYNVVPLGTSAAGFGPDSLRGASLTDGIYVSFTRPVRVELVESTVDVVEFFYPNGRFRGKKMEWISYISGTRRELDATPYLAPATELPKSHTEGGPSMRVVGRCFANLPPRPTDYINRLELEADLECALSNDRHAIVTLVGRGGIGKTSTALHVLHKLAGAESDRFLGIIWLSARDIDLLPTGAKLVKPAVLSVKDIAREIVTLLQPKEAADKNFSAEKYVAGVLNSYGEDALLIVFDNFETVQQPLDVFNWLDLNVRSPNKILITTRHRDFRGDYPVEVGGMTEPQCNELVRAAAAALGMQAVVTAEFCREVYRESEGHPYVVKVLVGESAEGQRFRKVERIVERKDEILDALFERTYARLAPASRRVFLTLCNWRSLVPEVALEAALLRPTTEDRIDTQAALEELRRVSFVDQHISEADGSVFLSVPLVAAVFAKRKLAVSQDRVAVEEDTRFLQRFGAMQPPDVKQGLGPRIQRLFAALSDDLGKGRLKMSAEAQILEPVARKYPPAWLLLSQLWEESQQDPGSEKTKEALTRYLETTPPTEGGQMAAWQRIAELSRKERDWLGFVNAIVHISELPGAELATVSGAVNTFNSVNRELEFNPDQRRTFARRLVAIMEPKIAEGDSDDCSRLAWLFLQLGNRARALEVVRCGLALDPGWRRKLHRHRGPRNEGCRPRMLYLS